MNDAEQIVRVLLEDDGETDARKWPEFAGMSDEEWEDYAYNLPTVWLISAGDWALPYGLDLQNDFLIAGLDNDPSYRFNSPEEMHQFLDRMEQVEDAEIDTEKHIYTYHKEPDVPKYTLEQKRAHVVFEYGGYIFLKLPEDEDFIRREGLGMQHPVHGDTKIITSAGTFPIRDLAGKKVKLLSRKEKGQVGYRRPVWADAEVQSFGVQPLVKLTLSRQKVEKAILTTAEHRWYAFNSTKNKQRLRLLEKITAQLKPGERIPSVYINRVNFKSECSRGVTLSAVGVMHGIVFGDGHHGTVKGSRTDTLRPARITLYGKKDAELLKWFPQPMRRKSSKQSIGGTELSEIPRYYKDLPPTNETASYLLGWLSGYFAADGNLGKNGCGYWHSAIRQNLEFVEMLCQRFGIRTTGIGYVDRVGYTKDGGTSRMYHLGLQVGMPADFFLLRSHRVRTKNRTKESDSWVVKSVENMQEKAEVFCAMVPETGTFVLEGNIFTGNCLSVAHRDYCERMRKREIEVYSMTNAETGEPVVDIEVALTKGSYSRAKVEKPAVTQVRGIRNEMPPRDEYLDALMVFFREYGEAQGWQLIGHGVRNFDGRADGEITLKRWQDLQGER